jgi:predicted amidohydrolase YtcJ
MAVGAVGAVAQPADLIVVNANVVTLDPSSSTAQAFAVQAGRVMAIGTTTTMERLAGPHTRRIDARGRTVIPGLIDSHIHAVRAGLSFSTEVNWIGAKSIPEALDRLRAADSARSPGDWLIVAGGWTDQQFVEKRRPTLSEVSQAVPNRAVYLQMFYSHVLLTQPGLSRMSLSLQDLPPGVAAEIDSSGAPTGWLEGNIISITPLFDRLPKPSAADNLQGTRAFFTELNRLGVTGVVDAGGFNLTAAQYTPLFQLWREHQLTVRVAYTIFAQRSGLELADFQAQTAMLPMGLGDELLKFNGLGERITIAMYNNDHPDEPTRTHFVEVLRWAARQHLTLTVHWQDGNSAPVLLDMFEEVNRETPIAALRWSIAHLDNAFVEVFRRMKTLGVGWTMQDFAYLGGDHLVAGMPPADAAHVPPIMTALRAGVVVGAGTDAHRVASYNPFVNLQWLLDGRTVSGLATRGPEETPSREQALRMYTCGSAWFSFDEQERCSLEPGKLADFAMLDRDILTVPTEQIGATQSLLTVVGGRVVYSARSYSER